MIAEVGLREPLPQAQVHLDQIVDDFDAAGSLVGDDRGGLPAGFIGGGVDDDHGPDGAIPLCSQSGGLPPALVAEGQVGIALHAVLVLPARVPRGHEKNELWGLGHGRRYYPRLRR